MTDIQDDLSHYSFDQETLVINTAERQIAQIGIEPEYDAEDTAALALAYAKLFTASPKMLKALQKAVRVMRDFDIDATMAEEFDEFTDAITAAGGVV